MANGLAGESMIEAGPIDSARHSQFVQMKCVSRTAPCQQIIVIYYCLQDCASQSLCGHSIWTGASAFERANQNAKDNLSGSHWPVHQGTSSSDSSSSNLLANALRICICDAIIDR